MARKGAPKTLLEWNTLLSVGSLLTEDQRSSGKKLPLMEQARLMVKAMPRGTRVGEFVAMWTVVKYQEGTATVESVAAFWDEPVRTIYRRLQEFREVWGPAGHDTPDKLADDFIADYKARKERLTARHIARLLSADVTAHVTLPAGLAP